MTLIAGINAYNHNASASLIYNGQIVFAAEEERFDRVKYSDALPRLALEHGLKMIGAEAGDVDAIGYCWDWRHGIRPRLSTMLTRAWDPVSLYYLAGLDRAQRIQKIRRLPANLRSLGFIKAKYQTIPHHLCHAASAFWGSGLERTAILSVDGVGEWETAWMGVGENHSVTPLQTISFPNTLGMAYDAITQHLGFRKRDDAGKVMGLAAYGDPSRYRNFFHDWIHLNSDGSFALKRKWTTLLRYFGYGKIPLLSPIAEEFIGPRRSPQDDIEGRHADIAAALQERFEDVMLHMAQHLEKTTDCDSLVLAGGCALNCLANTRIAEDAGFKNVFIFPAATDAGAGTGAAMILSERANNTPQPLRSVYLGTEVTNDEAESALQEAGLKAEIPENLIERVAELLADGLVVGWIQGRMEFGPRALGNRSLLADPRNAAMKDRLNKRVKHRESFRPFAPACPEEDAPKWFEGIRPTPWMMFSVNVRDSKIEQLGAVTHQDGTARLQTVSEIENPKFHALLKGFEKRTGIPVLLNTSFNVAGQPVVESARDAVECFRSTGIDALVIGDLLVLKH